MPGVQSMYQTQSVNGNSISDWTRSIFDRGFVLLPAVLTPTEVDELLGGLGVFLRNHLSRGSIKTQAGNVFAARNLLEEFPTCRLIWKRGPLFELLHSVLGDSPGLVRVLYFDTPPDRTWSLPWHQDRTIAVREHRTSRSFTKPTVKAGVPHVEAPEAVLEQMLTLRFHLDEVTDENGPLCVKPGSHRRQNSAGKAADEIVRIHSGAGDVLAMRPLLVHSSGCSHPKTTRHRQILHLEFSGQKVLPEGFVWHNFAA